MAYLPDHIDSLEKLTNYVLESNKFKADAIHWRAFMPSSDGERSVFRMDDVDHESVIELGRVFVGQPRNKPILGWGRISAGTVREQLPLRVKADEPPPRHAVIDQWPPEVEQRRVLAMTLASAAATIQLP